MANRLAQSQSPYLRQHAENPVDWWEWGAEALAEAERRDLPILLSVGYAACHWCHDRIGFCESRRKFSKMLAFQG